jgi:Asp-tRNA(Asn)/Glu-tRNA(Gln) amidotransferase A subunit family amidase
MFLNDELSRRKFLSATAANVVALATAADLASAMAQRSELWELSAADAVAAMKRGEVAAERYASTLLARCKAAGSLNAFITLQPEQVLEAAQAADKRHRSNAQLGALHGLPIPLKDSINTRDLPTTGGTRALRGFRPRLDAPLVVRLRDAGAIVLGKTNLHEISMGYTSANLTTGAVHNPYDSTRSPGGSSGGSAAAVAARLAPLSVAEDTAGSIRVPAAMCGIVGFRPTTGRYPSQGVLPMTKLFDQLGPHARTVSDVILFDAVVTGDPTPISATSLRGVKFGVFRDYYYADLDPEVGQLMENGLRRIRDAGATIVEVRIPDLADFVSKTAFPIIVHDLVPSMAAYLAEFGTGVSIDQLLRDLGSDVKGNIEATKSIVPTDVGYRALVSMTRPLLQERFASTFKSTGVSAIVFPTTPTPPVLITQKPTIVVRGNEVPFDPFFGRNVVPGSTSGLPGLVLPVGLTRTGLPVGIEFDGPAASDRALLGLGLALEGALGAIPPPKIG